jgi:hypothetical protein
VATHVQLCPTSSWQEAGGAKKKGASPNLRGTPITSTTYAYQPMADGKDSLGDDGQPEFAMLMDERWPQRSLRDIALWVAPRFIEFELRAFARSADEAFSCAGAIWPAIGCCEVLASEPPVIES